MAKILQCFIPEELRDKFSEGDIFTVKGYPGKFIATFHKDEDSHSSWRKLQANIDFGTTDQGVDP